MMQLALSLFKQKEAPISWLSEGQEGLTFVIMPKWVKQVLRERLFARKLPVVFSSATLSVEGSFAYMMDSLGIEQAQSFSVASPYQYEEKMIVKAPKAGSDQDHMEKCGIIVNSIAAAEGGTLVLFPSMEELEGFKLTLQKFRLNAEFLFEGTAEISSLIQQFQQSGKSVLCAVTLWEGLDIPGPALSQVIMWELPFPPRDPVFDAKRAESAKPFDEVDVPYMLLRLRQGLGRLIRTREDEGTVIIFGDKLNDATVRGRIRTVLPEGVVLTDL